MIRITVELVKWGDERLKRPLGVAEIWNDASGTRTRGNYKFRIWQAGTQKRLWKEGALKNFPRERLNTWDLMFRMLGAAVGARNGAVTSPPAPFLKEERGELEQEREAEER